VLKTVLISLGWLLCYQCYLAVKDIEEIKGFVPHEILGIQPDAELSTIKRAYRALSREKHPDKNPDNPAAVTEFIQITKAYTVSLMYFLIP
jgi:DnaJ-class molecular chaperone